MPKLFIENKNCINDVCKCDVFSIQKFQNPILINDRLKT